MKKLIVIALALICVLSMAGCNTQEVADSIYEDFSFSLTWGVYGISSYDTQTGKLVICHIIFRIGRIGGFYQFTSLGVV